MVGSNRNNSDNGRVEGLMNKLLPEISLYWLHSLIYKLTLTKSL